MVPTVFWTQIITGEKENQEKGIDDSVVGKLYRYIGFRRLWWNTRDAERHLHCCVTLTEQKTHRSLALIVGCRKKEKIKESALPVNSKKKSKMGCSNPSWLKDKWKYLLINGNDQDRRVSSIVQEGKQNNPPTEKIGNADHSEKSPSLTCNRPAASVCVREFQFLRIVNVTVFLSLPRVEFWLLMIWGLILKPLLQAFFSVLFPPPLCVYFVYLPVTVQ